MYFVVLKADCSTSVIRGRIKRNNQRKKAKLRFSSDGGPKVTFKCKFDDGKFKDCKLANLSHLAKYTVIAISYIIALHI